MLEKRTEQDFLKKYIWVPALALSLACSFGTPESAMAIPVLANGQGRVNCGALNHASAMAAERDHIQVHCFKKAYFLPLRARCLLSRNEKPTPAIGG